MLSCSSCVFTFREKNAKNCDISATVWPISVKFSTVMRNAILPVQSNSSMHHYECVALCKDISPQRGRFCTRSLASCTRRSSEDRSSWMFFIQVVRGRPGGRLQFSGGCSKMAWLASAFSSIRARCPWKVSETTGLIKFITLVLEKVSTRFSHRPLSSRKASPPS